MSISKKEREPAFIVDPDTGRLVKPYRGKPVETADVVVEEVADEDSPVVRSESSEV